MAWFKADPIWSGQTVAILGGGPSLTPVQVAQIASLKRIAVNNAYQVDPDADVVYWGDTDWYLAHRTRLARHGAPYKITANGAPPIVGLNPILMGRKMAPPGISTSPQHLAGQNSGHQAINLAYHFGAKRILLLGFDMTTKRGNNWHPGHASHASEDRYVTAFIPEMKAAAEDLKALGVEVLNCSSGSALTCFPMTTLEELGFAAPDRPGHWPVEVYQVERESARRQVRTMPRINGRVFAIPAAPICVRPR